MTYHTDHERGRYHVLKTATIIALALAALLTAFQAGKFVGYRQAMSALRWDRSYPGFFASPPVGRFSGMRQNMFFGGHGFSGSILNIQDGRLLIKSFDGTERVVQLDERTVVRRGRAPADRAFLVPETRVVVIGRPDEQGVIQARLIRLFPN